MQPSALPEDVPPLRDPRDRRSEAFLLVLLALAVVFAVWPVVLHPGEVLHGPLSDVLAGHHPYRVLQQQALRGWCRITLWDPTSFGGMPLLGDPQTGLFYPLAWPQMLTPSGEGEGWWGAGLLLHLLIAAFGTALWLRGHGLSRPARFAGATTFALSGKWIYHVLAKGHMGFLPLAWLPWQLLLVDRIQEAPSPRRSALLALCLALMITGAHPQLVLYGLFVTGVYAAFVTWRRRHAPGVAAALLHLAGAALLALGLVTVHVWPALELADQFVRGGGFDWQDAARRSLEPAELVGFLVPTRISVESGPAIFVGAVATALALVGLADRRRRAPVVFWWSLAALFVGFALGENTPLFGLLYDHVPGLDWIRYPNRILVMLGLPFAFLAATGLDRVAALAWPVSWRRFVPLALAALVLVDQARFALPLVQTAPIEEALGDNPVVERVSAPVGTGRVYAFDALRKADVSSLPVTYATRAGIEILRGLNPLVPRATAYYLYRGVGGMEMASPHAMTIQTFPIRSRPHLDLFNVRWVVANQPQPIAGLELRETLRDLELYHFQRREGRARIPVTYVYENVEALPRAWLVREARLVQDAAAAVEAIGAIDPRRTVLLEDASEVARYAGGYAAVPVDHRYDEIRMHVDAGAGGYLVLSEVWFPGWHARVDGEAARVLPANGIFRALRLGPGEHEIRMWYAPRAWRVGRWISLAALGLLLALLLWPSPRPRGGDAASAR